MHSFICPVCEEPFLFSVQEGIEATKEVFLRIVHIHDEGSPRWQGVIHEKGARNVEGKDEVVRVTYAQGKARRDQVQKRAKDAKEQYKKDRLTR